MGHAVVEQTANLTGELAPLVDLLAALGVHGEVDLDVVPRDLLAEEQDLLAALGGGAVVRVVDDLENDL